MVNYSSTILFKHNKKRVIAIFSGTSLTNLIRGCCTAARIGKLGNKFISDLNIIVTLYIEYIASHEKKKRTF